MVNYNRKGHIIWNIYNSKGCKNRQEIKSEKQSTYKGRNVILLSGNEEFFFFILRSKIFAFGDFYD